MNRFQVSQLRCQSCKSIQGINKQCINCGISFGKYSCLQCRLFDNSTQPKFHCKKCKVCRVGKSQDFQHCDTCQGCIYKKTKVSHKCLQGTLKQNCPICLRDQNFSRDRCVQLPCGHTMHSGCFQQLSKHQYKCPLCYKSFCSMAQHNKQLDEEIQQTPMPAELQNKSIEIMCNDCHAKNIVQYHILGAKCVQCSSYNTRLV